MKAMGFVETKGLVALVAAIDVMETAANVQIVNCFAIGGGRTAIVSGDVGSVRAAVEAGAWVADQNGRVGEHPCDCQSGGGHSQGFPDSA